MLSNIVSYPKFYWKLISFVAPNLSLATHQLKKGKIALGILFQPERRLQIKSSYSFGKKKIAPWNIPYHLELKRVSEDVESFQ